MSRILSYREYYHLPPDEFLPGDMVAVKLVCVVGYGGDYAVYAGTTDMSDEEVAATGDKVDSFKAAKPLGEALFSSIAHGRHYRG